MFSHKNLTFALEEKIKSAKILALVKQADAQEALEKKIKRAKEQVLLKQAAEEEFRLDRKARKELAVKCAKLNAELLPLNVIREKPITHKRDEAERGSTNPDRRRERDAEEDQRSNRHKSVELGRAGGDGRFDRRDERRVDERRVDDRRDYRDGEMRSSRQETDRLGDRTELESGHKKKRGNSLEPHPGISGGYEW